jgi:hypothetical protein
VPALCWLVRINALPTDTHYFGNPVRNPGVPQVNYTTDAVIARIGINYKFGFAAAPAVYK